VIFTPGSTLVNEYAYWCAAVEVLDVVGARGMFLGGQGALLSKQKSNFFGAALCASADCCLTRKRWFITEALVQCLRPLLLRLHS
jgi:hypothetical protein